MTHAEGNHAVQKIVVGFGDGHQVEISQCGKKANRLWAQYFFENDQGNQVAGVKGTLWAAYNGVTELIDHRQTGMNDERRLQSAWFGGGYQIKAKAFRIAASALKEWTN